MRKQRGFSDFWALTGIIVLFSTLPAWITHVIVCIKSEQWVFLLAGAICAPVGVIHGWGVWLGIW